MLTIDRNFSLDNTWEDIEWETRTACIKDDSGNVIFQMEVEAPVFWSDLAVNVVASKYLYGDTGNGEPETSIKDLILRVADTIAHWGLLYGYFRQDDGFRFQDELRTLLAYQYGSFNSPVWFNVGLNYKYGISGDPTSYKYLPDLNETKLVDPYAYPQSSACFIQSVEDDMGSIMALASSEANLFKYGSGTGSDLSKIRSSKEKLSGGGTPSGPMSFLKIYDKVAGVVKSGGKTRRAAKMNTLHVAHPDIMDFINCKAVEEKKARTLIEGGYDPSFNGDAYGTVAYQNANLSVRVTDAFLAGVCTGADWETKSVTTGETIETIPATEIWEAVALRAWECGDPGVQFVDAMESWNTVSNVDKINCTNPCSEFVHIDNTACNLASLNLIKFADSSGLFDYEKFQAACELFILAQEILVEASSYPTKAIAENSFRLRPLGLGYSNLGALVMKNGFPYDSDEARSLCANITATMHGSALLMSAKIAEHMGPFELYDADVMMPVIRRHQLEIEHIDSAPRRLKILWDDVIEWGRSAGFSNSQVTVLAPTGTISFMMDCQTTGIEPDIALVKYKQLAGGGNLTIVNDIVEPALENLGYPIHQVKEIRDYISEHNTVVGSSIHDNHVAVFDCAFGKRTIDWRGHIKMMAAAQPFLSGAISKTVNLPNDATVDTIMLAYEMGHQMGLKAIAVYRDGCKASQPLTTSKEPRMSVSVPVNVPVRVTLPDTREAVTHKFQVGGHTGYITVGLYENGQPGELFVNMAKEGSTVSGLMDTIGIMTSLLLQHGVALDSIYEKLSRTNFEPRGWTSNKEIRSCTSVVDYIFTWMFQRFSNSEDTVVMSGPDESLPEISPAPLDSPPCSDCGSITVRAGSCYLCHTCGSTSGCG